MNGYWRAVVLVLLCSAGVSIAQASTNDLVQLLGRALAVTTVMVAWSMGRRSATWNPVVTLTQGCWLCPDFEVEASADDAPAAERIIQAVMREHTREIHGYEERA